MAVRAALILPVVAAGPAKDLVKSFPGWDGELLSRTWSGHIPAGTKDGRTLFEHYLFFESEGDAKTDPLIMWTNGGPGASSLFGSFVELGPYYLSDASMQTAAFNETGVPTLFRNLRSWTKLGSLLIRNLPPPVGFSYCEPAGPAGDGNSCGAWDDASTAKHSFEFLNNWFKAFPEFGTSDLYLTGESYAGIYVPTLAREILKNGDSVPARQLKGFAVGDACLGGAWGGPLWEIEFQHGHGQFSTKTYEEIHRTCDREELAHGVKDAKCQAVLDRMDEEKGYSYGYNLYDECYDDLETGTGRRLLANVNPHHMDGSPCGGQRVLDAWTARADVREALHVAQNSSFFDADGWDIYSSIEPELVPFYRTAATEAGLRVLVYNGDTDPGLNSFNAENWTKAVGFKETEAWRPWTTDGQMRMGGFVTRYEHNFDFLTIRGSGHMVPQFKPEAAYTFMKAWLAGEDYPRLQKKSSKATIV